MGTNLRDRAGFWQNFLSPPPQQRQAKERQHRGLFASRWGRDYDYMVVFDADSFMAGETLVRLAQMMDHYPQAGANSSL